jgi:FkbM family methyltransferase
MAIDLRISALGVQTKDGFIVSGVSDRNVLPWLAKSRDFGEPLRTQADRFSQVLRGGGTYLDIGANLGLTTIPLAQQKGITIHAFEPDPVNFRMLSMNLAVNCPGHQVSLHQFALGDRDGTEWFELNPINAGDHRLSGSGASLMGEDRWQRIEVQLRRLDSVLDEPASPLVVKIDVQGAEARVFAGGKQSLEKADLIAMEWYPYLLHRVGGDPESVISVIAEFRQASMIVADQDHDHVWQSGPEVANRMREVLRDRLDPWRYYEVLAMR